MLLYSNLVRLPPGRSTELIRQISLHLQCAFQAAGAVASLREIRQNGRLIIDGKPYVFVSYPSNKTK